MKRAIGVVLLLVVAGAAIADEQKRPAGPAPSPAPTASPSARPSPAASPSPRPAPFLEGVVQGPDGKPVEKALVSVRAANAGWRQPPSTARTDDKGSFRLALPDGGPANVRVEAKGFAPWTRESARAGEKLQATLDKGLAIEGSVRDGTTGAPLAGVSVDASQSRTGMSSSWERELPRATTGAQGRFRVEGLGRGLHTLTARARGYGRSERASVAPGARVDFFLFPGASLSGTVVDGEGKPLAGSRVQVETERRFRAAPAESTDAQGRFELAGLDPGPYDVVVRHEGLAPGLSAVTIGESGEETVSIALAPGARVSGRLLGAGDRPVAGGTIVVAESDGRTLPRAVQELLRGQSGDDGRFGIERVPSGSLTLALTAPRYAPGRADVVVAAADVDAGDVRLDAGLTINGRVKDKAGQPIAGAQVEAYARRAMIIEPDAAQTEADGSFVLAGLQPGPHELTASASGFAPQQRTISAGSQKVEFALERAGGITGIVVDEAGRPIESFRVVAELSGADFGRAGSRREPFGSAEGRFQLDDLAEGRWALTIAAPEKADETLAAAVKAGSTTDLGRIRLSAGGSLRGVIVDSAGSPVPGATVTVRPAKENFYYGEEPQTQSDAAGSFEMRGVRAGVVDVSATHPAYADAQLRGVEVDPARGPSEVRLTMSAGGRVEGHVRRRDGSAVAGARLQIMPMQGGPPMHMEGALTDAAGAYAMQRLPPGRARVMLMAGSAGRYQSTLNEPVEVREGETATVDFVLREVLVSGRVTRSSQPVAGLQLKLQGHQPYHMAMSMGGPTTAPPTGAQRMSAVTREDGSFEMIADGPGPHTLSFDAPDARRSIAPREVEIPDADSHVLEIALSGVTLAGSIVDEETGRLVPDSHVWAARQGSERPGRSGSQDTTDGRFAFEVEPGQYRLTAGAEGYGDGSVDADVPESGAADVRLAIARGVVLEGRVVSAAGSPVEGAFVNARDTGAGASRKRGGRTLADGSFRIDGLRALPHDLAVRSESSGFAFVNGVTPGGAAVTLRLQPGGRVHLQVRGPGGDVPERCSVDLKAVGGAPVADANVGWVNPEGQADFAAPAGSVTLSVMAPGSKRDITLDVPAGGTVTSAVTLEAEPKDPPSR